VILEGTPYDRGLTHGKTLKDDIHEAIRLWKADLKRQLKKDPDAFIKQFVRKTDFIPAIKKWTPDLIDEIRGLAEGSGIDLDTMWAYQLVDEVWIYAATLSAEHCSGLGFARTGREPTHIAQNMDLECFRDGTQTVLHIKYPDSDLECLVLTCVGMIGLNGLNNKGVGVCCNTLSQLGHCQDGLPVNCVIRGLLQQRTEKEAVAFLRGIKHASGQNYILGGRDRVFNFECSAGKVVEYKAEGRSHVVYHTNHPLVNEDYNALYRAALKKDQKNPGRENSFARFEALRRRAGKESTNSCVDLIKAALASKDSAQYPICRSRSKDASHTEGGFFTWASTIMVLSDRPELFVTAGPPDTAPYQRLTFSNK
jgi:predicted choloylglycine hydrolase